MVTNRTTRRKNALKFDKKATIKSAALVIGMLKLFNHLTVNSYLSTLITSIVTIVIIARSSTAEPSTGHEFKEYLKTTCLGTATLALLSIIVIASAFSFFDSYSSMFTGLIAYSELLLSFSVGAFWILIQQFKCYRKKMILHEIQ
ncbi:hypothetical protein KCA1_0943 [Lactiplantibacillus pentosus KCA1]|nr:hypothetical protein [Lactiplantibacillus pentosus]EIW14385.1 hypothetical protein KCA1_0943 [Lactiplantibacillus pentosus KCA1]